MSGVTGVLLSYGPSGYVPPWNPDFTMTNVDIATFRVTVNTEFYIVCEGFIQGDVPILVTPPAPENPYYRLPYAYVDYDVGEYPYLGPDPAEDGGYAFPQPDYDFYENIDWGSGYPIWFGYGGETGKFSIVAIDFSSAISGWPTQTKFSGRIHMIPGDVELDEPPTVVQVTPWVGGVMQRAAYASENLINVGGTSGTPYSYNNFNYYFGVDGPSYKYITYVDFEYIVATKTFFGIIKHEIIEL